MQKEGRILVVDDEAANVRLLERILQSAQYIHVASTTDSRQALEMFDQFQPDLVLTDLLMPHLDGFALVEKLRARGAAENHVPIVVLTADVTSESKRRALALGVSDFLTKPFDHSEVLLRVRNLLEIRSLHVQAQRHNAILEEKVRDRTRELEVALKNLAAAQQKAVQHECLRALGVMAGGIAHDFNNSLASILGYSELLLRDRPQSESAARDREYLQIIITAARDAAGMIARLREFSRPQEENCAQQLIPLNQLIQQTVALTVPKWKTEAFSSGLTILMKVEEGDIPFIDGSPAELREMLTNLIFNAVDAMPRGGTILIRTLLRDGRVVLQVGDSGVGMPEEIRQRCFEPFFSTKGDRGTGLGLAMVYAMAKCHRGVIDIESVIGKGTTFSISFPIAKAASEELSATVPGQCERPLHILAVDDQPLLCELLRESLSADGHRVATAANGHEALARFRAEPFDVVITDKAMPEMDGGQLALAIREIDPAQPVILLTGFGELADPTGRLSGAIDLVLTKPVSFQALRQALADTTARHSKKRAA